MSQAQTTPTTEAVTFAKRDRVRYKDGAMTLAGRIVAVIVKNGKTFCRITDADFTGVFDIEASLVTKVS